MRRASEERDGQTYKFSCHAHEPNGDNKEDGTSPGVHVWLCISQLLFLAQCFKRDFRMWHGIIVLSRRIVQVDARANVAVSEIS